MTPQFVRIRASSWDRLRDLQRAYDLDVFGQTAKRVGAEFAIDGLLEGEQIERLRADGYVVEPLANADEVARERMEEQRRKPGLV